MADLLAWIRVNQKLISRYEETPIPSHSYSRLSLDKGICSNYMYIWVIVQPCTSLQESNRTLSISTRAMYNRYLPVLYAISNLDRSISDRKSTWSVHSFNTPFAKVPSSIIQYAKLTAVKLSAKLVGKTRRPEGR